MPILPDPLPVPGDPTSVGGNTGKGSGSTVGSTWSGADIIRLVRQHFLVLLNEHGLPDEPQQTTILQGGLYSTVFGTPWQSLSLTSSVDDLDLSAWLAWRLDSNGAYDITGIAAPNVDGEWRILANVGANNISLQNEDGLSSAQNRIVTGTGAALVLAPDGSATLIYDRTSNRWRVVV